MKIPDGILSPARCRGILASPPGFPALGPEDLLKALASPCWPEDAGPSILEVPSPGETVCIVVSDYTRKTGIHHILPHLLKAWSERGCDEGDITFLVASGIHRHPTRPELHAILGEAVATRFDDRIFLHDPDNDADLVHVGTTKRGHPVRVNRRVLESDRLVLTGTVTFHYHAGYGGGRKSLVPGLASRDTIAHNHSLTLDPVHDRISDGVEPGRLDGNPVSEAMYESACFCRPDIILNTVLSPDGSIVGCFSGDLDLAHRTACRLANRVYRIDLDQPADLVVASAGSAPNWIQSHKALFNAHRAMRPDGCLVLEAPCPEGLGDERFRYWIRRQDPAILYRELRQSVEVLGQTALSSRQRGIDTILVTRMPEADCRDLGIETAPELGSALQKALTRLAQQGCKDPSWYAMPDARYLLPFVRNIHPT